MIRLIILFATLAIALPSVVAKGALPFGTAVSQRFLERETNDGDPRFTIPPEAKTGDKLGTSTLAMWVNAHADLAGAMRDTSFPSILSISYVSACFWQWRA